MHLQLRFKHTHILLQENNNTVHGSNSKISTHNPTSQIKNKIIAKVLHITQHYQVHSTNISQHYSSTSQQHLHRTVVPSQQNHNTKFYTLIPLNIHEHSLNKKWIIKKIK